MGIASSWLQYMRSWGKHTRTNQTVLSPEWTLMDTGIWHLGGYHHKPVQVVMVNDVYRYDVSGYPTIKFFPKDQKDGVDVRINTALF